MFPFATISSQQETEVPASNPNPNSIVHVLLVLAPPPVPPCLDPHPPSPQSQLLPPQQTTSSSSDSTPSEFVPPSPAQRESTSPHASLLQSRADSSGVALSRSSSSATEKSPHRLNHSDTGPTSHITSPSQTITPSETNSQPTSPSVHSNQNTSSSSSSSSSASSSSASQTPPPIPDNTLPPSPPPPDPNQHPMQTRSKNQIFKPKIIQSLTVTTNNRNPTIPTIVI